MVYLNISTYRFFPDATEGSTIKDDPWKLKAATKTRKD